MNLRVPWNAGNFLTSCKPVSCLRRTLHHGVSKYGGGQYALRSVNLVILFKIRKNWLRSGRSRSLYLSIRRMIKQIVIIIGDITFSNYVQNFIQHPTFKVNSRGSYWGSSVWISTQQVNYWSYILHSSNTGEKMGIQWSCASSLYRLQESVGFSWRGGLA